MKKIIKNISVGGLTFGLMISPFLLSESFNVFAPVVVTIILVAIAGFILFYMIGECVSSVLKGIKQSIECWSSKRELNKLDKRIETNERHT